MIPPPKSCKRRTLGITRGVPHGLPADIRLRRGAAIDRRMRCCVSTTSAVDPERTVAARRSVMRGTVRVTARLPWPSDDGRDLLAGCPEGTFEPSGTSAPGESMLRLVRCLLPYRLGRRGKAAYTGLRPVEGAARSATGEITQSYAGYVRMSMAAAKTHSAGRSVLAASCWRVATANERTTSCRSARC